VLAQEKFNPYPSAFNGKVQEPAAYTPSEDVQNKLASVREAFNLLKQDHRRMAAEPRHRFLNTIFTQFPYPRINELKTSYDPKHLKWQQVIKVSN
jgi:hypothetical protein